MRLFNGLNLSMTIVSAGGFLPTNNLNQIIKTNIQELMLIIALFISMFNIYFFYNIFKENFFFKKHYEDVSIFALIISVTIVLLFFFAALFLYNHTVQCFTVDVIRYLLGLFH